jgi:SAM-dependent methyltransferase
VNADQLFLPAGYSENIADVADSDVELELAPLSDRVRTPSARLYRDPVYRFAAKRAHRNAIVLDVGCGIGNNLARRVAGRVTRCLGIDELAAITVARAEFPDQDWVAADLRSNALWSGLGALEPDLVICADVIEHIDDPVVLLARLHGVLTRSTSLVLSTPDRDRIKNQPALGPPRDPHHIREWTYREMTHLLESQGFAIRSSRHLFPCRYPLTVLETKIAVWRAIHLRPIPGRRSTMVFELVRA